MSSADNHASDFGADGFQMSEPHKTAHGGLYAFVLKTTNKRLFACLKDLRCVARVRRESAEQATVLIHQDFDIDEAWLFIRTELHTESQFVPLDKIWEDALWL